MNKYTGLQLPLFPNFVYGNRHPENQKQRLKLANRNDFTVKAVCVKPPANVVLGHPYLSPTLCLW